jgi:hypothetical protein
MTSALVGIAQGSGIRGWVLPRHECRHLDKQLNFAEARAVGPVTPAALARRLGRRTALTAQSSIPAYESQMDGMLIASLEI